MAYWRMVFWQSSHFWAFLPAFTQSPIMTLQENLQSKIDAKTKPLGALGQLERLAMQIGLVQNTSSPELIKPTIIVFAGDHGVAQDGVSAYPPEVTHQMVLNFLHGGAAINVFARQHGLHLRVVDAGVNHQFEAHPDLVSAKVGTGTRSFLQGPAMTAEQLVQCLALGAAQVEDVAEAGSNVVGFGEMGIGNTSAAAMLMAYLCDLPLAECVGRGTGVDDAGYQRKLSLLQQAREHHGELDSPKEVLAAFAGFEMAQMCGAMLEAQRQGLLILVDGFIATSVYLAARAMVPEISANAVFCHQSDEAGHAKMLEYLGAEPLLRLGMRLGEGTGCAVAWPIIQSAVAFLQEMASFESAQVSNKAE